MHLGVAECHTPFLVTVTLTSDLVLKNNCGRSTSHILFEIGIPNLVCECILGWSSVLYHLRVSVTLTFDLICRIIVSRTYLLYYLNGNPKFDVWIHLWMLM